MESDLDDLAFQFFKLFAQYEFALKALQFAHAKGDYIKIEWDRFAIEIGATLLLSSDPEVVAALDYIFKNPPKR